jgi:hypothetical protein
MDKQFLHNRPKDKFFNSPSCVLKSSSASVSYSSPIEKIDTLTLGRLTLLEPLRHAFGDSQYYIEYVDGEPCEEAFGGELPPVLLICDTPTLQRRVQRYLRRMADGIDEDELKFLVSN